jgi:multicomponent Na+:H+ antiporter subunit E
MNQFDVQAASNWRHSALVFFTLLLIWLLLVGSIDAQEVVAGVLVSAAVLILFGSRLSIFAGVRWSWLLPVHIGRYLAAFAAALVAANIDLARRVLTPSLPIRPALVEVRTGLRSPLGRMVLANTITLTPGTLSVDVVDDRLLVHWVYLPVGSDSEAATRAIVEPFENHLRRFLR